MSQKLCGEAPPKNVVIVTTMWDKVTPQEGLRHEQQLRSSDSLKAILGEGAIMMRHNETHNSAADIISYILWESANITQFVREIDQKMVTLEDTATDTKLHSKIRELLQQQESKMDSLKLETKKMLENARDADSMGTKAEQVIAIMGPTGAGKSSFIYDLLPLDLRTNVKVGHNLQSQTIEVQPVSWTTKDGKRVKLVDTPGFDDSRAGMTSVEILKMIAKFLTNQYKEKNSRLTGLIYVHRISDPRMGGTAQRSLQIFQNLCGKDSLKNVVIVTTMWDKVTKEDGIRREEELKSSDDLFKPLLDGGATMMRYDRHPESGTEVIECLLGKSVTTTQIVREIIQDGKALEDTAAGTKLQSEIRELLKQHSDEMKALKDEMRELVHKEPAQERQKVNEEMQKERQRMDGAMTRLLMELDELKRDQDRPAVYECTSNFPVPETKCITDCSKLLGLVKEYQSTLVSKHLDIASSVASCIIAFADAVEKSLKGIQSASTTLKPVLKSQDVHSLQQFMRMDPHLKTFTQGTWTKAQHDMEMVTKDIEAILSKRGMLHKIRSGRRTNNALKEILGSAKEVIADMGAMVDWWMQVIRAIRYVEDAASHKTGEDGLTASAMVALTHIIDAFDAYCKAYATCPKNLHDAAHSFGDI
ncbi:hypothetical protein V8B97DRAFT_1343731 [Scleroderma yunnanense]